MAAKWQDVKGSSGNYNLQYRTAGDNRVREEHAALNGTTLPATDPFWRSYYPPNGWMCRCNVVEVRKEKFPESDSKEAIRKGDAATDKRDRFGNNKGAIFRFNPGAQERIFPEKHPYFPKGCGNCNRGVKNMAYDPKSPTCAACIALESCRESLNRKLGREEKEAIYALPLKQQFNKVVYTDRDSKYSVRQHCLVSETKEDYSQVLAAAKAYAKEANCQINPEVNIKSAARQKLFPGITNNTNPDLRVEPYGWIEVKTPKSKGAIVVRANEAATQNSIVIITDIEIKDISMKEVEKFTQRIFSDKHYTKDEVHWLIKGELIKCNRPRKN